MTEEREKAEKVKRGEIPLIHSDAGIIKFKSGGEISVGDPVKMVERIIDYKAPVPLHSEWVVVQKDVLYGYSAVAEYLHTPPVDMDFLDLVWPEHKVHVFSSPYGKKGFFYELASECHGIPFEKNDFVDEK